MRICRYETEGAARYGIVDGGAIHPISGNTPYGPLTAEDATVPLPTARLLAPVVPSNVLAIGRNYQAHVDEGKAETPARPLLFIKTTTSVIGPGDPIVLPTIHPNHVDFEAELAVVIGRTARHVSEDDALDYVLGYTCGNDVSQRLCQKTLDGQWARAKSFDSFCPLGPWIETDLEPHDLVIRGRLNGETMQDSRTSRMIFPVPFLISYLSRAMTLLPGTVLLTGTPSGVGVARTPPRYLQPGDAYTVAIEGIGDLTNPVVAE